MTWPTPQPCVNSDADLARIKAPAITPSVIAQIAETYRSEPVHQLRSALNAYVSGTANAETTKNLSPYGKQLARSRFILLVINKDVMGGWMMRLQFRHHMDSMYEVWLYAPAGSAPTVRYMQPVPCSLKQIRTLNSIFSAMYAVPYDG